MAKTLTLQEKLAPFPSGAGLINSVSNLRSALVDLELTDEGAEARRRRTLEVLGLLESSLATISPSLITNPNIESLAASVVAVQNHLAYITPPQETVHYENQLNALIEAVRPLVGGAGTSQVRAVAAAATASIEAADQIQAHLEALEVQRADLARMVEETESQKRLELARVQGELDGSVALAKDSVQNLTKVAAERLESDRVAFVKAAEETTAEGEQLLQKMKELLAVSSDLTLSTDYGRHADAEAKSAERMRRGAVAAGVTAVLAGVAGIALQAWASAHNWQNYDAWSVLPGKLAVIAALAAIAAYLGRQSSTHRRYSEHLRNAQLELRNLGPYLAPLPASEQERIRADLVATFFGKPAPEVRDDAPTTGATVDQLLDLLKVFAKGK